MLKWLGTLIDSNEKELKRLQPFVDRINSLEPDFERLSNDELCAKTEEFKARHRDGESLDGLVPEAFAAVREAAKRTIGQRHFDVQLMGGIVLHQGKIAEMKTGEGKTLVATLPMYLNSLTGQGCHLVTVNDYLAKRDAHWMGPIYHALGVSVTSIQHQAQFIYDPDYESEDPVWHSLRPISRREAYLADITYGTNNEFGFDYLRDNMVVDASLCVQRSLNYAIVDEVDNILIDEARTPLIISGPREESPHEYQVFARIAPQLQLDVDYKMNEKGRSVDEIYESGYEKAERILQREGILKSGNLYDNATLVHHLRNAITAKESYHRDQEYIVKDGEVIIVDEFTGRLMFGRRYSSGLHQAIEAKERVKVQRETMTYATITFQNYFRMYSKLAGMTGTAVTEAEEFHKIYTLEVVVIPTNEPMIRQDLPDQIYRDEKAKFKAVVREVEQLNQEKRPILIGTVSIEKSEMLSEQLKRKGISHQVLNAKQHEKEAGIIAQAGSLEAVTVATNMAGRGVDIVLGGNPEGRSPEDWQKEHEEVVRLGGLHIIGTERHEARRIDNQLRGRSGRQGDPGSSRFYVSLEDDIMRRFGGDRVKGFMEWVGMDEDTPIENKLVNRSIESAQVRVEGYHFDIRKHLVEYDDVVNTQRELVYNERRKILSGADLKANILSMVKEEIQGIVVAYTGNGNDREAMRNLIAEANTILPVPPEMNANALAQLKPEEIEGRLAEHAEALYEQREQEMGADNMRMLERLVMLRIIDNLWIEHLTAMEDMRQEAGWQSLRQVRPVDAYKSKGYDLYQNLMSTIQQDVVHTIYHVSIAPRQPVAKAAPSKMAEAAAASRSGGGRPQPQRAAKRKVGRNDPCPCGSGKKYKHCCGR
jgi:preprotein translocase subunit SecA